MHFLHLLFFFDRIVNLLYIFVHFLVDTFRSLSILKSVDSLFNEPKRRCDTPNKQCLSIPSKTLF